MNDIDQAIEFALELTKITWEECYNIKHDKNNEYYDTYYKHKFHSMYYCNSTKSVVSFMHIYSNK